MVTRGSNPRCKAHSSRTGKPCQRPAMHGQQVCQVHGGMAPQNRAAAELRIQQMTWPALSTFNKALRDYDLDPALAVKVAMDILDRNGFKAAQQVQADGKITIEVEYVGAPAQVVDVIPGRPLIEFLPEALEDDVDDGHHPG